MQNDAREFIRRVGKYDSLYRVRQRGFGYRYVLTDGIKEKWFDTEKEVLKYLAEKETSNA